MWGTIKSQNFPISAFNYSTNIIPGYNVLLPDSSNQHWQVGRSAKFDGVLSVKPALYTDTLSSYPVNMNEGVVMILHEESQFGFPYHQYDVFFKHRFETDTLNDGGYIEISLDSGATWVNAIDYMDSISWPMFGNFYLDFLSTQRLINGQRSAFTGSGVAYRYNHIHLGLFMTIMAEPELIDYPVAPYIRFNFVSDSVDHQKAGWQIDEVEIWGAVGWGLEERVQPITISPNPSNGIFNIQSVNHLHQRYTVTNTAGKVLIVGEMEGTTASVNLDLYPAGTYFLNFESGTAIKLIKN